MYCSSGRLPIRRTVALHIQQQHAQAGLLWWLYPLLALCAASRKLLHHHPCHGCPHVGKVHLLCLNVAPVVLPCRTAAIEVAMLGRGQYSSGRTCIHAPVDCVAMAASALVCLWEIQSMVGSTALHAASSSRQTVLS